MTRTPNPSAPATAADVVTAAMNIAKDTAEGRLDPAELQQQAVAELRALVVTVAGPDDPVWPVQLDVCRAVLVHGGIPADELDEWAAVARHREGGGEPAVIALTAPETPTEGNASPAPESSPSEPRSAEPDTLPDSDTDPNPQPPRPPRPAWAAPVDVPLPSLRRDGYDPLAGWSPSDTLPRP